MLQSSMQFLILPEVFARQMKLLSRQMNQIFRSCDSIGWISELGSRPLEVVDGTNSTTVYGNGFMVSRQSKTAYNLQYSFSVLYIPITCHFHRNFSTHMQTITLNLLGFPSCELSNTDLLFSLQDNYPPGYDDLDRVCRGSEYLQMAKYWHSCPYI